MLKACPQPDILINNAGGPPPGDFRNWTRDDWIKALDANMLTPIELIKATVDGMMARKWGRIVNITSAAVKAPIDTLGLSNGARAGLTGFVAGLSRKTIVNGVTINGLLPGPFVTDRIRPINAADAKAKGVPVEDLIAQRSKEHPSGRFGDPAEFGAACAVPVQPARRLHHRPKSPAGRRRVPRHAVVGKRIQRSQSVEHAPVAPWERAVPRAPGLANPPLRASGDRLAATEIESRNETEERG